MSYLWGGQPGIGIGLESGLAFFSLQKRLLFVGTKFCILKSEINNNHQNFRTKIELTRLKKIICKDEGCTYEKQA